MNISKMTDCELIEKLSFLCLKEREATLQMLYHLMEFDSRELYLELGYSTLHSYCTKKLGFSEGSAFRRTTTCRVLRTNPEIAELLLAGKVTLCSISTAFKSLKEKSTKVESLIGKSKREVELIVAKEAPKPRERIKPIIVPVEVPSQVAQVKEERFDIRFSFTKEMHDKLEEAKNLLSNKLGNSLSLEKVFGELIDSYLKSTTPKRNTNVKPTNSRYIPVSVKDAVLKRDQKQCTFHSKDGNRCSEKRYLHIDHIQPLSLGGKTEESNLRVLCSAHNLHLSRELFG